MPTPQTENQPVIVSVPPPTVESLSRYPCAPRCFRFWRWPRRERSADIRSDLGQASNEGQRQKRRNPSGESALGRLAALLAPYRPLRVCSSLAPCHPTQGALARGARVSRQALKRYFEASEEVERQLGLSPGPEFLMGLAVEHDDPFELVDLFCGEIIEALRETNAAAR